ncbi:MAG: sulfatase-like hydrolase/transferase [bacterium]
MNNKRKGLLISVLFLVLFVGFNLLNYKRTLLSISEMRYYYGEWGLLKTAFYWSAYASSIAATMVLLLSVSRTVRWIGLGFVFIFVSIEFAYQAINGQGVRFFEVLVGVWEISFAGQAAKTYTKEILSGLFYGVLLISVLATLVRYVRIRFRPRWLAVVPVSLAMVYSIIWKTSAGNDQFPPMFKIPLLLAYTLQSPLAGKRDPVALEARNGAKVKHLIFIIDESIRGDFLGINRFSRETTPYLDSISDRILNLGLACSGANCSQTSNIILQSGVRLDQLPDRKQLTLKLPNIFQYAKAAGYKTYFLEGQYPPGKLPPHMSQYDLADIDEVFQIDKSDSVKGGYNTDFTLAARIKDIVKSDTLTFILVNKRGVHFFYEDAYPPEKRYFKPVLTTRVTVNNANKNEVLKSVDRTRMINSYCNGIRWSVDGFFRDLLPALRFDDTVLLYTSDHGQSIKEGSSSATHCTTANPPSSHAAVPLFVMGKKATDFFTNGVSELQNHVSHFQIFPSLLIWMGYDVAPVQEKYGVPLWVYDSTPRKFLSGDLFGRGSNFSLNEFHFKPYRLPGSMTHELQPLTSMSVSSEN